MPEVILAAIKDFGFPITLCGVLLWAIRSQNMQLVKSYTDRIKTLENAVNSMQAKITTLEGDRMTRSDHYATMLKELSARYAVTIREHNELTRDTLSVLRRLVDQIGDPRRDPYADRRYRKTPSSADIPSDPAQIETDRLTK